MTVKEEVEQLEKDTFNKLYEVNDPPKIAGRYTNNKYASARGNNADNP